MFVYIFNPYPIISQFDGTEILSHSSTLNVGCSNPMGLSFGLLFHLKFHSPFSDLNHLDFVLSYLIATSSLLYTIMVARGFSLFTSNIERLFHSFEKHSYAGRQYTKNTKINVLFILFLIKSIWINKSRCLSKRAN